jgi:hypothetical protein
MRIERTHWQALKFGLAMAVAPAFSGCASSVLLAANRAEAPGIMLLPMSREKLAATQEIRIAFQLKYKPGETGRYRIAFPGINWTYEGDTSQGETFTLIIPGALTKKLWDQPGEPAFRITAEVLSGELEIHVSKIEVQ